MITVVQAAMALLFAFAAAVQYNDPDPLRWMAIYLAAAGVAILAAMRRRIPPLLPLAVGGIALVWAAMVLAGVEFGMFGRMFDAWEMASPSIEQAREVSGLAIVAAWMFITAALGRRR